MSANFAPDFKALVGIPVPAVAVRIAPVGEKLELRLKGPCVTPGYWRSPDKTAEAFDAEGYYRTGDAVAWIDSEDKALGLRFDGRIAENFKLASGTWVQVADLRAAIIGVFAPLCSDVVICAPDRPHLTAILFPEPGACRKLAGLPSDAPLADVVSHPALRREISSRMGSLQTADGPGSRTIRRYVLTAELPNIETGELSDKRAISQNTVLARRAALVDALYADEPGPGIEVLVG
ncbi:hypothetical protein GCM10011534_42830 [Pseudooceanicola nanhaiensis]|jgi:feruloyl-CoA synthase|uniref:AMP-dependent synthetase/ligase domain-containing protein n=1 Tax=Pseudooceanicola nanhaiensis TaxID=375761 RepID=A0A917WN13_9RHOB|nr:AMP-binding protein [Pseudooceanicola nanhaiensis]GGM16340.1 hypothetical protein GCM10011534_42830 [Pseudooceanicola nanhaiensis]